MTEADTCREFVTPKLVTAGWGTSESVIGEQHSFTNGRIIVAGGKVRRGKQRRADYLLYYRRDMPLAVVEARDPKGLYARARRGEIPQFTGIDAPYEAPEQPELRIDTADCTVDEAVDRMLVLCQPAAGADAA